MRKFLKRALPFLFLFELCFVSLWFTENSSATARQVIPGGSAIGLKIYVDGLLVVGKSDIPSKNGKTCPGDEAGVLKGDRILKINGEEVTDVECFCNEIQKSGGDEITLVIAREKETIDKKIKPVFYEESGEYKIGLWVRDSAAGIGTVTFILSDGTFGALGHGISDVDTKKIINIKEGEVSACRINSVMKGQAGTPGDLRGSFSTGISGTVYKNTPRGIFGVLSESATELSPVETAVKTEIKAGKAQIISSVEGFERKTYDAEIETVFPFPSGSKNMVIKITDPELLEKTGGIVQGMSGSPIVQNGKLVGAVTHVFVNDPTRGYGIFIENMLAEAEKIK